MKYSFTIPPLARFSESTREEIERISEGIFGIADSLPKAAAQLNLSEEQIQIFCKNTPGKKKGLKLFDEFKRRRSARSGYYFNDFMREVLAEAGYPLK